MYMKKFQTTKGFLFGITTCLLVSNATVFANAESLTKQLTAYFNGIKLVVDGKKVVPQNAKGDIIEPFVVDGTTYLPVRAVAEALGQTVSWDASTSTVYIGANNTVAQPTVWLKDLDTLTGEYSNQSESITDNLGNSYTNHLTQSSYTPVSYALNGQYSRFAAKFVLTKGGKDTSRHYRLKIYCDDNLTYTTQPLTAGTFPIDVNVNIQGANVLKFVLEEDYNSYSQTQTPGEYFVCSTSDVSLVNAGLWK